MGAFSVNKSEGNDHQNFQKFKTFPWKIPMGLVLETRYCARITIAQNGWFFY